MIDALLPITLSKIYLGGQGVGSPKGGTAQAFTSRILPNLPERT